MNETISILRHALPFLVAIFLWRISGDFWNPAGILATIVLFYSSFVRPVAWFPLFSLLMCILIDYKFETILLWTGIYCMVYAIVGFQSIIDLGRMDKNALYAYAIFISIGVLCMFFSHVNFAHLFRGIWLVLWACTLYIPITELIKRYADD